MTYRLTCLICGMQSNNLVLIQEHAMYDHGYRQEDHHRAKRRDADDGYVWAMPDGVEWLHAKKETQ